MFKLNFVLIAVVIPLLFSAQFGKSTLQNSVYNSFGKIWSNFTETEQQRLRFIFANSRNETKAAIKTQINTFVAELTPTLQQIVTQTEEKINVFNNNITQKVQPLSSGAKELVANITSVINNQEITVAEEQNQINNLLNNANQAIMKELYQSGISLSEKNSYGENRGNNGGRNMEFNVNENYLNDPNENN